MNGFYIGIPASVLTFLAINHYFKQIDAIGDPLAIAALAASVASLVYFFARAFDILENKERDNPKPLISPQPLPECFGNIKELLTESSMGLHYWSIRAVDPDQGKISALMRFTEIQGGGLAPTIQIIRQVMLDVEVQAIPEEEQVPTLGAQIRESKGQSSIQMVWRVDSPVNRFTVNNLQEFTKGAIEEAVGLRWVNKPKEQSVFMPPKWLLISLLCAVIYAGTADDAYQAKKKQLTEPTGYQFPR